MKEINDIFMVMVDGNSSNGLELLDNYFVMCLSDEQMDILKEATDGVDNFLFSSFTEAIQKLYQEDYIDGVL